MQQIDLTVLFASRNGEKVLSRTLSAYRRINQANVSWKLVIVDNGSSDSTLEIIKYFQQHLPIEICLEPVAGKNRALNRGLHAVEGQLIVVTDDDTLPSPSFLQAWAKFIDRNSDYGLFGGSIIPLFESTPQSWLTVDQHQFIMLFGARDLPEGPVEPEEIFGGNMAIRRSVFDWGFRFNENVGPNGIDPNYRMGGETEFCRRVVQAGFLSWFAREPVVQHVIRPHQLTDRYWADRSYRSGRGAAYRLKIDGKLSESELVALRRAWRKRCRLCCQLRMLSPFSAQRRRAINRYYQMCGFTDELKLT